MADEVQDKAEKKKKKSREEQIEHVQMTLEEARKARKAAYAASQASAQVDEATQRARFQEWWAQARGQFEKTDRDLEGVIWAHLKAIGKTEQSTFEAGVKHFGLKKLN
jgi:hypothetical protein